MASTLSTGVRGVDGFWESECATGVRVERVLPTGRAQVVIDLERGVATLVGPRTASAVVEIPRHTAGFSLAASGLAHVVGGDASEFVDTTVNVEDLGFDAWSVMADRTGALRDFATRMVSQFEVDERLVLAEDLLRAGTPARSVSGLLGLDRRQFVPAFRTMAGLAPKQYEVLVRLQRAKDHLRAADEQSLTFLAHCLGFADQAHMNVTGRPELADLPLPKELADQILRWNVIYSEMLDWDDPGTPIATPLERELHYLCGLSLAQRLANALGQDVYFFDGHFLTEDLKFSPDCH